MNGFFTEYTKRVGFSIELTDREIQVLLYIVRRIDTQWRESIGPKMRLESMGLIKRIPGHGQYEKTKAGEHMAELLIIAGHGPQIHAVGVNNGSPN